LARASVSRLAADGGLTVVGETGSSGKTSTNDLKAAVLAPLGTVVGGALARWGGGRGAARRLPPLAD
ncbi:hypothetical protein, partial [Nocardia abscessus]|uniref:hypothetical protein n=1 Tax=Nocardia abscessus TaxID=120957 RepID=UPI002457B4B8